MGGNSGEGDGNCEQHMLVQGPLGSVAICPGCGIVHLSMDCVSIRLEVDAFESISQMMLAACNRLHELRQQDDPPIPRAVSSSSVAVH